MRSKEFLKDNTEIIGPGTDLVISLVAIFMVLLVLTHLKHTIRIQQLEELVEDVGTMEELLSKVDSLETALKKYDTDFENIKKAQLSTIKSIAQKANADYEIQADGTYIIPFSIGGSKDIITIINDATLQRFRFGNKILFDKGRYILKSDGEKALAILGDIIKEKRVSIKEIQIQGHADADRELINGNHNLELAGNRSQEVFKFFRKERGIDPSKYVMYASSFGEFMPTERNIDISDWNENKMWKVNVEGQRAKNRRIEIVLNYR